MNAQIAFLLAFISVASFQVAIPSTALAQRSAALAEHPVLEACAPDLRTWCNGSEGEARQACIATNFREFSLPCQLTIVKFGAVSRNCQADIKKNCASVLPGRDRVQACLKDHFTDLSARCKETMWQAARRRG
ncbi:Cysteine rich repeat-containing protein [Bradyrhizobium shewense]|uniref:Cysteine rich repeat-containing protein n=1 Tax=Bradyrhizobium shewense TaxID=1761772 RepID=A0A1C3XP38_9BRAD|nr:Cysteine rich repeat-containing protein [Bradyrhizobium shewense]